MANPETDLFAYIRPNKLGEPHQLVLSGGLRRKLGWEAGTRVLLTVDIESEQVTVTADPGGSKMGRSGVIYAGSRLDDLANRKQLSTADFAAEIEGEVARLYPYQPVTGLRLKSGYGRPRQVQLLELDSDTKRGKHLKHRGISKEMLVEMLALAGIAIGENAYSIRALMEREHPIHGLLPSEATYRDRFGSWERAVAYARWRERRLADQGMDEVEAEAQLKALAT